MEKGFTMRYAYLYFFLLNFKEMVYNFFILKKRLTVAVPRLPLEPGESVIASFLDYSH